MPITTNTHARRTALGLNKTEDTRSAVQNVFETVELLEPILALLPIRDLLVNGSRVSRGFKATIDGSPTLQAKLFFRQPTADPPAGVEVEFNSLLVGSPCCDEGFLSKFRWHDRFEAVDGYDWCDRVFFHLTPEADLYGEFEFRHARFDIVRNRLEIQLGEVISSRARPPPRGSWQRMFLSRYKHDILLRTDPTEFFDEHLQFEDGGSSKTVANLFGGPDYY